MPVSSEKARRAPEVRRRAGSRTASQGEGFPRSMRLLRRSDYLRVQRAGNRVHTPHFVILLDRGGYGQRLGVTVGRRVGSAVRRNRIKRVVREVFRRNHALFPADCDVVLVARPGAERLDYASVANELTRAQSALSRVSQRISPAPNIERP